MSDSRTTVRKLYTKGSQMLNSLSRRRKGVLRFLVRLCASVWPELVWYITMRPLTNAFYIQPPRLQPRRLELAQRVRSVRREKQRSTILVIAVIHPAYPEVSDIRKAGHIARLLAI